MTDRVNIVIVGFSFSIHYRLNTINRFISVVRFISGKERGCSDTGKGYRIPLDVCPIFIHIG